MNDTPRVSAGDKVVVRYWEGYRKQVTAEATVVKAARVWLDITSDEPHWTNWHGEPQYRSWRMGRDIQMEGDKSNYNARFYTPEQWEEYRRVEQAGEVLRAAQVDTRFGTFWNKPEMRIKLAEFIAANAPDTTES